MLAAAAAIFFFTPKMGDPVRPDPPLSCLSQNSSYHPDHQIKKANSLYTFALGPFTYYVLVEKRYH